jgi:hypothetical protein
MNALMGPMLMEGKMLEQVREQANFNAVLHDEKDFKSMETVELTQYQGQECYKLKLVKTSGQEITELYETKTGLLIGFTGAQESPLGLVTVTNLLSEYKKFGDVLFATKTIQQMGPMEMTMKIGSFEFDKVEDTVFELPPQIKALISK